MLSDRCVDDYAGTLVTVTDEENLNLDFGFKPAANAVSLAIIGNTVWIEVDGDISTDAGNYWLSPSGTKRRC